jgi:hypothetical protein
MKRTTISAEQIELWNAPSIASQLPVKFSTGFTFTGMRGCCAECGKELADHHFNGKVLRPTPQVAEIFAVGYCQECKLITPFRYRMYDDKRFTTLRNEGWCEGSMKNDSERKVGMHHKLGRMFRWLFTF